MSLGKRQEDVRSCRLHVPEGTPQMEVPCIYLFLKPEHAGQILVGMIIKTKSSAYFPSIMRQETALTTLSSWLLSFDLSSSLIGGHKYKGSPQLLLTRLLHPTSLQ